ncbi:MAG: DUF5103 domain-containing protein [Bacteroidota bacterium]|nr:DUF5103 domain-containing protein [Bacteroidota bacterium]
MLRKESQRKRKVSRRKTGSRTKTRNCSLIALFLFTLSLMGTGVLVRAQVPGLYGDSLLHTNHIFSPDIKTVQLHKEGWEISYPILKLNSKEKLKLSFDDLKDDIGNYYYTFIHCNADWNPSDLMETNYLEGFPENQITNYQYSFNTTVKYIHYQLTFPNEDISFRISGNYILYVYNNYNKEEPLLTRRFMVTENLVNVKAQLKRPTITQFWESGQEISISVNYSMYQIANPFNEVKVVLSQNGRWDNAVEFLKPSFMRNREIVYDFDRKNIFSGGSEYRYFDAKSLRYQTEYVQFIDFRESIHHVALFPSKPRTNTAYFYEQDVNGKFYIKIQEGGDSDIESDYMRVYFTLNTGFPEGSGDVYVFGALSDWTCNENNRMIFNYETSSYETSLILKQGYYNYEYVRCDKGSFYANNTVFEGSHYETENDYLVFVYHMAPGSRYDRLVGSVMVNSVHKTR